MPAKSASQYGAMAAAAAGHSNLGIPQSVGEEFMHKTAPAKRKKYAKALARRRKQGKHSANFDKLREMSKGE